VRTETRVGIFILVAIGVFIYLSINIKAFRLDQAQYYSYKTYFDDTGGLDLKSPARIAGVDVGWVESIILMDGGKAEVNMRVHRRNKLAKNAYATISQEGLIGTKVLEIDPGDPSTGILPPGSTLAMPGKSPASVSDLLDQFRDIASSVYEIATSLKNVIATPKGEADMKMALNGIAKASTKMADFSEILDRTLRRNEENINATLLDMRRVMAHLDTAVPSIRSDFNRVTLAFADDTLPKLSKTSERAGTAFESIDDAAIQTRETFKEAEQVVEKINTGKGVVGKLINEDETYGDLKKTIKGFKDYVTKSQSLAITVDMHSEKLFRSGDSKGYFDLRIRPNTDCFYVFQLVMDEYGSIKRDVLMHERYDKDGNRVVASDLLKDALAGKCDGTSSERINKTRAEIALLENPETERVTARRENDLLFGFQFGKRFDRLALRIGLFENSFGVGCDYYVPLPTDKLHWITTLEAFDFKGTKRINDSRPHLKWMNRLFFMKHVYTTFGIDDMVSNERVTPFWGGGIRFNDDDLKYVFSLFPLGSMAKK